MEEPPGFPARPTFAEVSESLALTDGRDCEMHVWIMNHWTLPLQLTRGIACAGTLLDAAQRDL